jgi:peptide/nickel transport system substrate-binding protein
MVHITRRQALVSAAAATAAPLLTRSAAAQGKRPDLRIAAQGIPGNLEPIELIGNTGNRVANALYDTVIYRDFLSNAQGSGTTLRPGLAESWRRLDARTVEVTLRPNVKFHHGETMTAEDVAFSLGADKLWGPKPISPRGPVFAADFDAVEVTGPMTVRFVTKTPDVSLEQRLASWVARIVPKKYFLEVGADAFATKPIGTGPFKLKELRSGERLVLEAHDAYWMGRPTAETVTFIAVPEVSTRIAGLISGEFDIVTTLPADALRQLQRQRDVEPRGVVIENVHLILYQSDEAVLQDKRIRQALNLAIDRKLMSDSIWGGLATVPNGFQFPEYGDAFEPSRAGLSYNPEKARALLREAGYANQRIVYRTLPAWYANAVPAAQMVQQFWKQVGVNADVQIFETWQQLLAQPGLQVRNWSNGFQMPDPVVPLTSDWGPRGSVQRQNGWKAPDEYNALVPTVVGASDPVERKRAFQRLIDIWEDEAPGTILYRPYELYGVRKGITWRPVSFEFMELRPNNLSFTPV